MVATRDISALELILSEKAAAVGPKLTHNPVCVSCLDELEEREGRGHSCPLCSVPLCSARCDGGLHTRLECQILAGARPPLRWEDFQSSPKQ